MELDRARKLAEELIEKLRPACERIEVAGSIRREKPDVKDIEIVAIPILKPPVPQFGEGKVFLTELDRKLWNLQRDNLIDPIKGGQKYKQFRVLKEQVYLINVDLFLVTPPAQWGVIDVIRTGPSEFSHWMVTQKSKGGALPNDAMVERGQVFTGTVFRLEHPMPEEKDFFEFCGLPWIEPRERVAGWNKSK